MGAVTTLGKYGIGLGFLYNAFSGTLSLDNLKGLADDVGIPADFLENGTVQSLIGGKEGPLSLIIGSLLTLPSGMAQYGVGAGFAWLAAQLYQSYKKGALTNTFNQVLGATGLTNENTADATASATGLTAAQRAEIIKDHSGSAYVVKRARLGIEDMALRNGAVTQGIDGAREIVAAGLEQDDPALENS